MAVFHLRGAKHVFCTLPMGHIQEDCKLARSKVYIYIYHSGKNWVNRPQHRRRGIVLLVFYSGAATLLMEKSWMKWHNIGHKELNNRKASSLKMYVSESLQNEIEAQVVADCAPSYARLDT